MPTVEIEVLFWRDIPAAVTVRTPDRSTRLEMPIRFAEAIDAVSSRFTADSVSQAWRFATAQIETEDPQDAAENAVRQLDKSYGPARLNALIANDGNAV
ncbi:virulence factor [Consotaella salsifontis]|uniref:Virulence factor n=1 Tax=Consotaella salsifontis TaxID=1365950 RepID=A0A1T4L9Z9_9HYPH|nr:virulence factor [Consotaella salsifontis]SJZ51401.1 Virulence factor [Consotaella salsifontis]